MGQLHQRRAAGQADRGPRVQNRQKARGRMLNRVSLRRPGAAMPSSIGTLEVANWCLDVGTSFLSTCSQTVFALIPVLCSGTNLLLLKYEELVECSYCDGC